MNTTQCAETQSYDAHLHRLEEPRRIHSQLSGQMVFRPSTTEHGAWDSTRRTTMHFLPLSLSSLQSSDKRAPPSPSNVYVVLESSYVN